jgi:hypothetical protein
MAISNGKAPRDSIKFMQVIDRTVYRQLEREGKARGITVQELYRAVIVPHWLHDTEDIQLFDKRNLKALVRHHVAQKKTFRTLAKTGVFKRSR